MPDKPVISLEEIARQVGRYPEEAYLFVRDALHHTVVRVHGTESAAHRWLAEYLAEHDMDWNDLLARHFAGTLEERVVRAIEAAGGADRLNRHVSGRELCWGLRECALARWGLLAPTVLAGWNIRTTLDFGHIVFALVERGLLGRQPDDTLEDFRDVYDLAQAFDVPLPLGDTTPSE